METLKLVRLDEQAMAKDKNWYDDRGLKAARRRQQPDWANL